MKVQYLMKAKEATYTGSLFSFKVEGGLSTWTSSDLIQSLRKGLLHPDLEANHGFSMCLPGEFL